MFAQAVAFLSGTLVICQLPSLAPVSELVPILCAGVVLLGWRRAGIAAFALAGILWAWQFGTVALAHGLNPARNSGEWLVTGVVASVPEVTREHTSFDLEIRDAPPAIANLRRLRLSWYEEGVAVRAGEHWRVMVRLRHVHGLRNPGDYDFEGKLFDEGIDASGYVVRCTCNARLRAATWRTPVLRARAWIAGRIAGALPASPYVGILQDLAVGLDDRVSREQWRVFQATGTTHLMAISGFHVAGLAVLAMGCVRLLWRVAGTAAIARADVESVAGLSAATGYALLAGFSVPTQRTLVTLAVVLGARVLRRATGIWDLLGLALIAVLALDPLASLSAGFWLSFATVAGILYALAGRIGTRSEWRDLVPAQIAATLCLLPLTLALFGTFSFLGPLINLLAIPLFTLLLVPAILAGVVLLAVPGNVGEFWFAALERFIAFCWPSFEWLGSSTFAMFHVAQRPFWALALLAIGMLWLLAPWPAILRILGLLLAVPAVTWRAEVLPPGAFELTVLDVGQGLSAYVTTREHALLFDTGPASGAGRAAAEFSVVPYLRSRGQRTLDALVLSHGDRDHIGGAEAIHEAVEVRLEYAGGDFRGKRARQCVAGDSWSWEGVHFEFLHPPAGYLADRPSRDNDRSCVLAVSGPGGSILLTGDIEAAAENLLVARRAARRVDVVVVPHHGSRSSSGVKFVAALAPRWAVVAAGYDNRWKFPKPQVLERWRAAGAAILTTAESGAIRFRFTPAGLEGAPEEYRRRARRFWHVD